MSKGQMLLLEVDRVDGGYSVCQLEHCWTQVWFSTYPATAHIPIWRPVHPCLSLVTMEIWITSTETLQTWLPRAECSLIVEYCLFFFSYHQPQASNFLSFPHFRNYLCGSERSYLKFRRLARERHWGWMWSRAIRAFVGAGLVFTLIRTFLGTSLNPVSLCERECYTECLLFSSKAKAEQRLWGASSRHAANPWRNTCYFNSPRSFRKNHCSRPLWFFSQKQ